MEAPELCPNNPHIPCKRTAFPRSPQKTGSLSSALITGPVNWEKGSRKREKRKCAQAVPSLQVPRAGWREERPAELELSLRCITGPACMALFILNVT